MSIIGAIGAEVLGGGIPPWYTSIKHPIVTKEGLQSVPAYLVLRLSKFLSPKSPGLLTSV